VAGLANAFPPTLMRSTDETVTVGSGSATLTIPATAVVRPTGLALVAPAVATSVSETPVTAVDIDALPRVPLKNDPELTARVSARLEGVSGRFGIAIKDLHTGKGLLQDPNGEYEAASLFKLPIMFEVFRQREHEGLSFSQLLTYTQRHVSYDLGTLDRGVGATIPLGEALERMVTISDNSSAILLLDRVGALNVDRAMLAIGMRSSRMRVDSTTTPSDMLLLLESIATGDAVNPAASSEMVRLLSRQRVNDRIPRLLPTGTIVAHKTGNLPGVIHDVGIVYGSDATLIVVVLVNGTSDEGQASRVIADLALMAYEHFSNMRAR
jgi:beta-lactamase class A